MLFKLLIIKIKWGLGIGETLYLALIIMKETFKNKDIELFIYHL